MGLTIINYGGFVCDKCGHKWITKDEKAVGKNDNSEKIKEELNKKKPKICPKCKSPKWNYLGLHSDKIFSDKEVISKIPKEDKKIYVEMIKLKNLNYRIKKVKEDIYRVEGDIKNIKNSLESNKNFLKSSESYLKSLREELQDLERANKTNRFYV